MTWEDIVPLAEIEMHSAKSNLLVGRYVLYKKKKKKWRRERKKERKKGSWDNWRLHKDQKGK